VPDLLLASDATWTIDEVAAAVIEPGTTLRSVRRGIDVLPAIREREPDLVILDLQIGNMGGMATCLDLRLEESAGRLAHIPVLMLLDRQADVFLAKRGGTQGWLIHPIDALRVRRAVRTILEGGTYRDGEPRPAPAGAA
jgi:DNA-binding response OmpR family regulator